MRKPSTRELFNYWNELRGTRSAPERRDIDPTRIRHALANTFILEAVDGDFRFRLAGSHLCSAYCRELKGRSFVKLWHERDRDAIETLIKAVTDDHAVSLVTFSATAQNNASLAFESILLPLRHNGATNSRIIGALTAMDDPYWLGLHPLLEQRISGLRLIWPDDHPPDFGAHDLSTGLGTRIGPTVVGSTGGPRLVHGGSNLPPSSAGPRRYAHLAVIDGGKH